MVTAHPAEASRLPRAARVPWMERDCWTWAGLGRSSCWTWAGLGRSTSLYRCERRAGGAWAEVWTGTHRWSPWFRSARGFSGRCVLLWEICQQVTMKSLRGSVTER